MICLYLEITMPCNVMISYFYAIFQRPHSIIILDLNYLLSEYLDCITIQHFVFHYNTISILNVLDDVYFLNE